MAQCTRDESLLASATEAAVLQSGQTVIDRAKQTGTSVVVWKDGRIVEVPGDDLLPNVEWQMLAEEHEEWLSAFEAKHQKQWINLLGNNREGALAEAAVRQLLQRHGVAVTPNEGSNGGPDFQCCVGEEKFYVEVTCISIERATAETGISTEPQGPSTYRLLNDALFETSRKKTQQCADHDAPVLLAICTFHGFAAMVCFDKPKLGLLLTGGRGFAWKVDPKTGPVGEPYLSTELRSAPFLRPDPEDQVQFAREPISGLLLCGVAPDPPRVLGILHPNPVRPFDPQLLPEIEFGTVTVDRDNGQLIVCWPSEC